VLLGDGGRDLIRGRGGNDEIDGGEGDDRLFGDANDDTVRGGDGDDLVAGGDGLDTLFGGRGDDLYQGASGDTYALSDFGSTETIMAGTGGVLDFSDLLQNLTHFVTSTGITVGFDQQEGTDGSSIDDFDSQVIVHNPAGVSKIVGSDFVDTFFVSGTAGPLILDGGRGNDHYVFDLASDPIDASVQDNAGFVDADDIGTPWNSGDLIEILGGTDSDDIALTSSRITAGASSIAYTPPAADRNVLQIKVRGGDGDDVLRVESTADTVPVRVDGEGDDDTIRVGNATTGVDDIQGILRPGLNGPFGLGPLVLLGGEGHDTVVVDDSGDPDGGVDDDSDGAMTAFLETRTGGEIFEVGMVIGLGMGLEIGGAVSDGRVEYEGFEVADVRLAQGEDVLTLGGGFDLLKSNVSVEADALAGPSQQIVTLEAGARGGEFVLGYSGETTAPIAFDGRDATDVALDIQTALNGLPNVGLSVSVSVENAAAGQFRVTFTSPATDVELLTGGNPTAGTADPALRVDTSFPLIRLADDLGDDNVLGIKQIVHTIDGTTLIDGGGGEDTIDVVTTQALTSVVEIDMADDAAVDAIRSERVTLGRRRRQRNRLLHPALPGHRRPRDRAGSRADAAAALRHHRTRPRGCDRGLAARRRGLRRGHREQRLVHDHVRRHARRSAGARRRRHPAAHRRRRRQRHHQRPEHRAVRTHPRQRGARRDQRQRRDRRGRRDRGQDPGRSRYASPAGLEQRRERPADPRRRRRQR
jgi:hypothetical protein